MKKKHKINGGNTIGFARRKQFCKEERAQSTVEYVLTVFILVIIAVGAIRGFGSALGSSFNKTKSIRTGPLGMGP